MVMCEPSVYSDDELDQLFENVALGEPDSFDDDNNESLSQVRLFAAVGSPADEPPSGASLALTEGNQGKGVLREALARGPPSLPHPMSL